MCSHSLHLAVTCHEKATALGQQRVKLRHVAGLRPDIQDRRADFENVVNLAGVNQPNKRIAHHHDVQVRRRKRH